MNFKKVKNKQCDTNTLRLFFVVFMLMMMLNRFVQGLSSHGGSFQTIGNGFLETFPVNFFRIQPRSRFCWFSVGGPVIHAKPSVQ